MIKDIIVNLTVDAAHDVAADFAISVGREFQAHVSAHSLMRRLLPLASITSARLARRPFTNAASRPVDIRSTTGATLKSISIGHAWPFMANENERLLIGRRT
jgi:hypothetical protein